MTKKSGERIKKKHLFKIGKARVDNYKGTVMVDLFDLESNRLYVHIHRNGEVMVEVFYLKDRLFGYTDTPTKEIKGIYQVIEEVKKATGIDLVYTAELEG